MLRKWLTSIAEVVGFTLITAGAWQALGSGVGLITAGTSLIVVSVVTA